MRIIRFLDENNTICFGYDYKDDSAKVLAGELFTGFTDTGNKVRVKKLLSPLQPPAVLCIGLNYREHSDETGLKLPEYPVLFMKNPSSVTNPGDPVIIPRSCMEIPETDYEVELAVVIGRSVKNISEAEALDYVFGYTIGNDISARRWQTDAGAGQWVKGKSFDTFCPLGPVLVTKDEIPDPQSLRLTCKLNGSTMQDDSTSNMIFTVAQLIAYLSGDTTLARYGYNDRDPVRCGICPETASIFKTRGYNGTGNQRNRNSRKSCQGMGIRIWRALNLLLWEFPDNNLLHQPFICHAAFPIRPEIKPSVHAGMSIS